MGNCQRGRVDKQTYHPKKVLCTINTTHVFLLAYFDRGASNVTLAYLSILCPLEPGKKQTMRLGESNNSKG